MPVDGTLQQTLDGRHLPAPTNQMRLSTPDSATPLRHAQQPLGAGRLIGAFDAHTLDFTQSRCALDQPRGGFAEHHRVRRGDRFHPLGQTHLLPDRGVTRCSGADLPGDHLPGVQPDPQLKFDTIAVANLLSQITDAVATDRGIINEPVFLGRRWGVGYMWTEAAVYSAVSVALGYVGWIAKPQEQLQKSTTFATDGQSKQPVGAAE